MDSFPKFDADLRCDVEVFVDVITKALIAGHSADRGHDVVVLDPREIRWSS